MSDVGDPRFPFVAVARAVASWESGGSEVQFPRRDS
jgi:hypothetical protein